MCALSSVRIHFTAGVELNCQGPTPGKKLVNLLQESVMLDAFYAGVTSCVDPDCRKSLKVFHCLLLLWSPCPAWCIVLLGNS